MMRILTMPHLREQLAEAGRNHAMQFLPDRFLDRILEGYQAALQPEAVVLETSDAAEPGNDGLQPRRDLSESERAELRRSLGVPGHGLLVLAGGGATAANRTEVLAAVLEALAQRHPGTVLALAGECERDELRLLYTWASRRLLRHGLLVTGNLPTEELLQWLAVADVVLAPAKEAVDGGFTGLALSHGHGPLLLRGGSCSGVPAAVAAWSAPVDGNEAAHIVGAVEIVHRRADVAAELVGAARAGAEVGAD
jgi:hypothetical protein